MFRKSKRINPIEPSTSSQDSSQSSQTRINQYLICSQVNINDQVNDVVRYLVNNAGQNMYFPRSAIQKSCGLKSGQQFQSIIEKATSILKHVYGYNLLICNAQAGSSKGYIVSNDLPYKKYSFDKDVVEHKEVQKIVFLLILSHIYMSNGCSSEASLHMFLKNFDIDVNVRHPLFGLVKDYISNTLIKQKFLSMECDPVTKKITYCWGIRAENEISKHEILKFVCKMYKDRQPKSWVRQFKAAEEQGFENERLDEDNNMEVEELL